MAAVTAALRAVAVPAVRIETGPRALDLLDDRWDELLLRLPAPNPLLAGAWLRRLASWRSGEPFVAIAEEDGRLVAGAAFELRRTGPLGVRVAGWLGPVEQQHAPDLLVDPERPAAGEAVAAAALEAVDLLSLRTSASGAAARALAAVAPWRRATPSYERWLLTWPPPRLDHARSRVARDLRRAERLGVEVEIRVAAGETDVLRGLVRLFRLHRERWRGRSDVRPGFAASGTDRRWNRETVAAMAAAGRVRLLEVVEDGRTVVASLAFVHGTGALGHTTAMARGGTLKEPGHLAMLACAEALAHEGVTVFDLGVGSGAPADPKLRLGPAADPLISLFAASSPARQRLYAGLRGLRTAAAWRR